MDETLKKKAHELTSQLAVAIGMAKDQLDVKQAVCDYVEGMDKYAHVLGDGDLLELAHAAMKRRGKVKSARAGR